MTWKKRQKISDLQKVDIGLKGVSLDVCAELSSKSFKLFDTLIFASISNVAELN